MRGAANSRLRPSFYRDARLQRVSGEVRLLLLAHLSVSRHGRRQVLLFPRRHLWPQVRGTSASSIIVVEEIELREPGVVGNWFVGLTVTLRISQTLVEV